MIPYLEVGLPDAILGRDQQEIVERLKRHGCVVLRNRNTTPSDFEAITRLFARDFLAHQNPSRLSAGGDDRTQSVTPGRGPLPLHKERAYLPSPPELLFFYCAKPAATGGQTTVCDGVDLLRQLDPVERRFVEHTQLTWTTRFNIDYLAWKWHLPSPTSNADLAALVQRLSTTLADGEALAFRRADEDALIDFTTSCLSVSRFSGQPALATYLLFSGTSTNPTVTCADGSQVPATIVERIGGVADQLRESIDWREHDVGIIDNTRMMHGRAAFDDVGRQLLARMGAAAFS